MTKIASNDASTNRWFCAYTQCNKEHLSLQALKHNKFPAFCPLLRRVTRHARKTRTVTRPMFPQYLFVRLNVNKDSWRQVNSALGISHVITVGGTPAPVPNGFVEHLLEAADSTGVVQAVSQSSLRVGARVRLTEGPFEDEIVHVDQLDDSGRVRFLLDMMGRRVPVWTPTHTLQEASSQG